MQAKLREMLLVLNPRATGVTKSPANDLPRVLCLLGFDFLAKTPDLLESVKFAVVKEDMFSDDDLVRYLITNHALKWSKAQSLREAFQLFDFDKDGKISQEEFQYFMRNFATTENDTHMSEERL
jgi:hypothetical protein